jgi:ATP-dependent exoDNAse (exonuclease V) alpha subunit
MPTTSLCSEVNSTMLQKIENEIHNLQSFDTLDSIVQKQLLSKIRSAYAKIEDDVTRTAGLEKMLQICVGARVMLKRNKDVELGLVNGSVVTVDSFMSKDNAKTIDYVCVKFDKIDSVIKIGRESSSFEVLKGIYYTRKQFPLMPAFAITIHKSQGLSLQSAIVDVGSSTFGPGMVYVAPSRVTSLNGLHLIDIDRRKITCDKKAIAEYNRLRNKFMPHLGNLSDQGNKNQTTE